MNWSSSEIAEAQALYDQGMAPSKIALRFIRRGKCSDLSFSDVRQIINSHRAKAPPPSPEQLAQIRQIKQTEWVSNRIIAGRVGISRHIVERACVGMRPPASMMLTCDRRSHSLQGRRTDLVDDRLIRFKEEEPIEVPAWVPDHLFELYEHTARTQDEHVAARVVRGLKRGNSVAFSVSSVSHSSARL